MTSYATFPDEIGDDVFLARVISVDLGDDSAGSVVLDQTCMYPRGGGQPGDHGVIVRGGELSFEVRDTVRVGDKIVHRGSAVGRLLASGDEVEIRVDLEKRILHSKYHTAAHLLDVAMKNIGFASFSPHKADHTPKKSYVSYVGRIDQSDIETVRRLVEVEVNRLREDNNETKLLVLDDLDKARELSIWPLPSTLQPPVRLISVAKDDMGACGGTHVRWGKDIGHIRIPRVTSRKGHATVFYEL